MTMNRHEPFEELISASLHGDLSADERRRLDAHLDGCDRCRATLAAFAEQRRIVAGLRHLAPPRDLGARVRTEVEDYGLPWWRRPIAIFTGVGGGLAVITGALLALVLLNGTDEPQVAEKPSPTASISAAPASPTPIPAAAPTLPPPVDQPGPSATPAPGETPPPEATPTPEAMPEATPIPASPEPDVFMAVADPVNDPAAVTVREGSTGDVVTEPETPAGEPLTAGVPIAAELSSDGQWLAFVSEGGLSGINQLSATRVAEGRTSDDPGATAPPDSPIAVSESVLLGESVGGSPFLERLAWSRDGSHLAFTLADPEGGGTDVWILEPATERVWQLTDVGDAYAGSWVTVGTEDETADPFEALWVSRADGEVTSYLISVRDDTDEPLEGIDPSAEPLATAEGVFQPLVSPNGALAIYWNGRMTRVGDEWLFVEGGAPWLAEHRPDDAGGFTFGNERELFSDIVVDRDAFTAAAISWGPDGDSYAVWDTAWTGLPQAPEGDYPDRSRVYFGHATDPRGLTRFHALDAGDLPADGIIEDVKVSPTGADLVITVRYPLAGDLEAPRADLFLVGRNTGDIPDDVETLREGGWNGPAAFDADNEIEAP
jgi:anti-sigma factor RsiW